MYNFNRHAVLERIKESNIITNESFQEIIEQYGLTMEDYLEGINDPDEFSDKINEKLFKKDNKNYHTITSKSNFNNLTREQDDIPFLLYQPLNDHSREYLTAGDILFSYRSGQFSDLDKALRMRGIYGLGIALSNPIKISEEYEGREEYKNYGVIVIYPFTLKKHLSVRDIQLNPKTINLTPYNGNRNDSLQYIPDNTHYTELLGMILRKNQHLKEAFQYMKINVEESVIPDEVWEKENKQDNMETVVDYKEKFKLWLQEGGDITSKTQSNYISGLNSLEKKWNENNELKISVWNDPYVLMETIGRERLLDEPNIIELNERNNRGIQAVINYYFRFLNELKKESIVGINRLYFGAPGTGKSYSIASFIKNNGLPNYSDKTDHQNVFRITLHPEFSYTDFVGQVMPVVTPVEKDSEQTRIEYKFSSQVFTKALKYSVHNPNVPVFLILEEMSRANVAQVFGDLFQLLDRDENGESEYRIDNELIAKEIWGNHSKKIFLPSNLFVLGTVNTSDQNVFVMDTAFKRRFEFEYMDTNKVAVDSEGKPINDFKFSLSMEDQEKKDFNWITFYQALNNFITNAGEKGLGLPEDKQLGQFFIKFKKADDEYNYNQLGGKLLEYLWNDVQKASFGDKSIFRDDLFNFSEVYRTFRKKENIFSEDFLILLRKNGQ